MQLIFATNNDHKIREISPYIANNFELLTLEQAGIDIDIPEPYDTLEANATAKSRTIFELTGQNCFSEDTGLETAALAGEPGVKSARYAGEEKSFEKNIDKLLEKLAGQSNRRARFRTVISLILEGKEYQFEGICEGHITDSRRGTGGFGYDPVFIPDGDTVTFGQMSPEEKNKYSHRKKALNALLHFLENYKQKKQQV